jgi:hypothetical protein
MKRIFYAMELIARFRTTEIVDADRDSQFTSAAWAGVREAAAARVEDKGRRIDNVYIDRVWRTVNYETSTSRLRRQARSASRTNSCTPILKHEGPQT